MDSYRILRELSKIPEFADLIKKITIYDSSNPINLKEAEKTFLLSIAIVLSNNYDLDNRYKSYAELAYYIILKYSIITGDYIPLYDFSVNFGFYPIAKFLIQKEKIKINNIINFNTQAKIEKEFKFNDTIETYDQHMTRKSILESKNNEMCLVAPTSFGKSSLIIEDIKKNMNIRNKISVIVPSKSLLAQTFRTIVDEIKGKKIIIHDEMYNKENKFLSVLTQERALRMLQKNNDLYFDILYIDEAHHLFDKDNSRTALLSRLIRLNKKRNKDHRVIYLSPLISNSDNLKFDSAQNIVEQRIEFNIKEPEIYEFCSDSTIQKYNRFIDQFYIIGKEESYLSYIHKTKKTKNFFFLISPKKIEKFASDLYDSLPNKKNVNIELKKTIDNLKKYIHEDFYGILYLNKGIIYLHGLLPDNIKEYLEYKFKTLNSIEFLVANTVILEGINLPINNLYILSVRGLSAKNITNLIGRVNRLNMIFNEYNEDCSLLLPTAHFINTDYYNRKDGNMKNKISKLRTGGNSADQIDNPLLLEFDVNKKKNEKNKEKNEKLISEEAFILDDSKLTDVDILRKKMIELGMNTVYDIDHSVCELLLSRIQKIEENIEENIILEIRSIFIYNLQSKIVDNEFKRLENDAAVSYYEYFVTISKKNSLKENIENVLVHFRNLITKNKSFMFIGKSYGEITFDGVNSTGKPVYVDLRQKNKAELVNLAIIKLKQENNFINYTMLKFFQLMLDYEIISTRYYNLLVYGTYDEKKLSLLKQGLTINLINRIDADNQISNIIIDKNNIAHGNAQFKQYKETLDDFFKFEINKFFN